MKLSLLFLVVFTQLLLLKAVHKGEASDLSELLEREITELKEENAKRGSRNPCAFTWTCRRRRRRKGRSFLEKRVSVIRFQIYNVHSNIPVQSPLISDHLP